MLAGAACAALMIPAVPATAASSPSFAPTNSIAASGPAIAAQANVLIARGDKAALAAADQLLSAAWVSYVQTLQKPTAGMEYADSWVRPRSDSAATILSRASTAPSLAALVR